MVVLLHVFQTEQSEKDSTEHSTVQQNIEMTLSIQETIHQTMLWGKRQVRRSNWDTWNEWRANVVSMSQGQTKQTRSLETNLVGFCHFSKAFLCFLDQGFSANKKSKNTRWGVQVLCKLTFQKMYGSIAWSSSHGWRTCPCIIIEQKNTQAGSAVRTKKKK